MGVVVVGGGGEGGRVELCSSFLRNFVVPVKEVMASSKQSHSAVRIESNPVSQAISKRFKTLQKYLPSP